MTDDGTRVDRPDPGWLRPDLVVAVVLLLPLVLYPLARDQGVFAYAGTVVLDGGLPYADAFDTKGPAMSYTYALAMGLLGRTVFGVRLFFASIMLVGVGLSAWLAERLYGSPSRLPTIVAVGVAYGSTIDPAYVPWHFGGQAEDVLLVIVLGVIWLATTGEGLRSVGRWAAMGGVLGLSLMFKPVLLPLIAMFSVWGVTSLRRRTDLTWGAVGQRVGAAVACGLVAPGLFMGWFAAHGVWDDFVQATVRHARRYAGDRSSLLRGLLLMGLTRPWLWLAAGVAWLRLCLRPEGSPERTLLVLSVVGTAVAVVWQGKYFPYHWTPLLVLGAISVGGEIGQLAHRVPMPRLLQIGSAVVVLLVVVPTRSSRYLSTLGDAVQVVLGRRALDAFRGPFMVGHTDWDGLQRLEDEVRQRTTADDRVVVWGHETLLHVISERRSPSRFTIDAPLTVEGPFRDIYRERFLADLERRPPELFLVIQNDETPLEAIDSATSLARFGLLADWLTRDFEPVSVVDDVTIWQRRVR